MKVGSEGEGRGRNERRGERKRSELKAEGGSTGRRWKEERNLEQMGRRKSRAKQISVNFSLIDI